MEKIWLVIIAIVFGLLVIGGMGSDNDKVSDNYYIEDDGLELMWINASDLHSFTPIAPYYTFDNGFIWTESHERLDYITFDEFKSAFDSTDDVYIAAFTFLDSENLERQLFVKVELDK